MKTSDNVDLDLYGRAFDGIFGDGAENISRRQTLLHQKGLADKMHAAEAYIELDHYGRGDPRIFGPNAHIACMQEAKRSMDQKKLHPDKMKLRGLLLPSAGIERKAKSLVRKLSIRLRSPSAEAVTPSDVSEEDAEAEMFDNTPRRVKSKLPSEEKRPTIEPGTVARTIRSLNSGSDMEFRMASGGRPFGGHLHGMVIGSQSGAFSGQDSSVYECPVPGSSSPEASAATISSPEVSEAESSQEVSDSSSSEAEDSDEVANVFSQSSYSEAVAIPIETPEHFQALSEQENEGPEHTAGLNLSRQIPEEVCVVDEVQELPVRPPSDAQEHEMDMISIPHENRTTILPQSSGQSSNSHGPESIDSDAILSNNDSGSGSTRNSYRQGSASSTSNSLGIHDDTQLHLQNLFGSSSGSNSSRAASESKGSSSEHIPETVDTPEAALVPQELETDTEELPAGVGIEQTNKSSIEEDRDTLETQRTCHDTIPMSGKSSEEEDSTVEDIPHEASPEVMATAERDESAGPIDTHTETPPETSNEALPQGPVARALRSLSFFRRTSSSPTRQASRDTSGFGFFQNIFGSKQVDPENAAETQAGSASSQDSSMQPLEATVADESVLEEPRHSSNNSDVRQGASQVDQDTATSGSLSESNTSDAIDDDIGAAHVSSSEGEGSGSAESEEVDSDEIDSDEMVDSDGFDSQATSSVLASSYSDESVLNSDEIGSGSSDREGAEIVAVQDSGVMSSEDDGSVESRNDSDSTIEAVEVVEAFEGMTA